MQQNATLTTTPDFITRLLAVDLSTVEPRTYDPVGKGEHVVGVMSDNLRRLAELYRISSERGKKVLDKATQLVHDHDKLHGAKKNTDETCAAFGKELEAVATELQASKEEFNLIKEIYWPLIRLEFPEIASKPAIGIREGGQVVWFEDDSSNDDPLDALFERLARSGRVQVFHI